MAEPGAGGLVPPGADGRRRLTFAAWDAAAGAVAGLFVRLGVAKGDVVCLLLPSSIDYAVCYQAAAWIGAVTTGVNLRMGAAEQASIAARVHPAVTVVDTDAVAPGAVPPGSGTVLERGALAGAWEHEAAPRCVLDAHDPVAIVWTSGSTGVPKGAVFDHANLRAVAAGTDVLSHPGDRRLSPLPFAHVGYMTRCLGRDRPRHHHGDHAPAVDGRIRHRIAELGAGDRRTGCPHPVGPDARPSRSRRC